ncbi:MAG: hypothetical protein U0401_33595 [Anaerolineae bacterium]
MTSPPGTIARRQSDRHSGAGEQRSDTVAMVGDKFGGTPPNAASVGIAMGANGAAQALETADVALMGDDLTQFYSSFAWDAGRRIPSSLISGLRC